MNLTTLVRKTQFSLIPLLLDLIIARVINLCNAGGIVMSRSLQNEVIEICRENGIVVLCDEVYRLLEHDPSRTR